jgi:hypothetical protein
VSVCTAGYSPLGAYAAAGPALRVALGGNAGSKCPCPWRGKVVYVNGVRVSLVDWCACSGNHVIDVFHATWVTIPHPAAVTIRW